MTISEIADKAVQLKMSSMRNKGKKDVQEILRKTVAAARCGF